MTRRVALPHVDLIFRFQAEMDQNHRAIQDSFRSGSHLHREGTRESQVSVPQPNISFPSTHDPDPRSLIGEHIDYALFGVFPAAVERDILIALAPRPVGDAPGVVVANAESKYTERTFTPSRITTNVDAGDQDAWVIDIDTEELRWDSYVKAGYYVRSR